MATVSKEIADKVVEGKGYYPGDREPTIRIVKYTNYAGGESYGLEGINEYGRYEASVYVREPEVYWEMPDWVEKYGSRRK